MDRRGAEQPEGWMQGKKEPPLSAMDRWLYGSGSVSR